jgi:hypothetical protein
VVPDGSETNQADLGFQIVQTDDSAVYEKGIGSAVLQTGLESDFALASGKEMKVSGTRGGGGKHAVKRSFQPEIGATILINGGAFSSVRRGAKKKKKQETERQAFKKSGKVHWLLGDGIGAGFLVKVKSRKGLYERRFDSPPISGLLRS